MTDWHLVWLGTMAVAMVVMTIIQVALVIAAIQLARQATKAVQDAQREIRPLVDKAHRIADDASRATALALVQVERVDEFMATTSARVDDVFRVLHASIITPLRQGGAVIAAVRAALAVFGDRQSRGRPRRDDEDALFIG